MIFAYTKEENGIKRTIHSNKDQLPTNGFVWLDLYNLTPEEEKSVESFVKINIPTREEMNEIEHSSRLYTRYGAVYMTAILVAHADGPEPESHAVTFILFNNLLITVRYSEFKAFKNISVNLVRFKNENYSAPTIYSELLKSIVENIADSLEKLRNHIDESAKSIFRPSSTESKNERVDYQFLLKTIGKNGILISKMRESLITVNRMLSYPHQSEFFLLRESDVSILKGISTDIGALSDYANFLSTELNFLLDATLGMVNIEQNNIIKIFSVVSVVFLPPTLIASMYGMNFRLMPELSWPFGYPLALIMMLVSAWLPFRFFKKRKWL